MTKIGLNATAAFKKERTGVEEYVYQLLRALTQVPVARQHQFVLYKDGREKKALDFALPDNFQVKTMRAPLFWTQIRLGLELRTNKPDVFFAPVHILPKTAPPNSVVTAHGLEYEYFPQYYPAGFLRYLRTSTKYAAKKARRVIAVSEATKNDLVKFYGIDKNKITIIYHGIKTPELKINPAIRRAGNYELRGKPYLLYLGRLELKKNVLGVIAAYQLLKEKYKIPHRLVLAGGPGFGYSQIKKAINNCRWEIEETGFVDEKQKWSLLGGADIFLFPSFYEGFGLPILEAQAMGVPVVVGNVSSMPEVAGAGAAMASPSNPAAIAQAAHRILSGQNYRNLLTRAGFVNIKRFSWQKCAAETMAVLVDKTQGYIYT